MTMATTHRNEGLHMEVVSLGLYAKASQVTVEEVSAMVEGSAGC